MSRKFHVNIPTDVLRTVVIISDVGSFSKAGQNLGLTQPAITAQIKRLQSIVGAPIFEKAAGGVALSETGRLMLPLIRRMLETNDQILHIGGSQQGPTQIKVGVPSVYCERVLAAFEPERLKDIHFHFDNSTELSRSLTGGYLDVCILKRPASDIGRVIHSWKETPVWVRSRDFTLSPGQPIPLIGRPGYVADQIAVGALEAKGVSYRFAFDSIDAECRAAAAAAGIGVFILPRWSIPAPLVEAKDYYLPAIPEVEVGVLIRREVELARVKWVVETLKTALAPIRGAVSETAGFQPELIDA